MLTDASRMADLAVGGRRGEHGAGTDWGTHQLAGVWLSRAAAASLGKDANEAPWN